MCSLLGFVVTTQSHKASYMLSWSSRFTALPHRAFRIFATQNSSSAPMKPDLEHAPKLPFPAETTRIPKISGGSGA